MAHQDPSLRDRARALVAGTVAVLVKDFTIELTTGEITTTAGFFAVLVAVLASLSFTTGPETTTRVGPGALWLSIAFSSVLALGRTWQREREESALVGLLVSPTPRPAIFLGKTAGVLVFVLAIEAVLVPLIALLFHVDLLRLLAPLAVVLFFGTLGVAATGSLFGAITVRTRARELLLASVLFPLLSPALLSSISATREIFYASESGGMVDMSEVYDWLVLIGVFDAVALVGGITMFGALLED
ncbi:MAG TPA: heme exporter protein CcmB [Polyangiaceae bacterium]|jgi:heme exporter protein B